MKYLVILFLFIVLPVSAQIAEINGRVLNAADNSPLINSVITLFSNQTKSLSDDSGYFSLKGKISLDDLLIITHLGFDSQKIKVEDFLNLNPKEIRLENKIITSQTILVRASIGKEGITPISFSKLSQANIKNTYSVQDIPEVLGYQPSITFYSENGNGIGYNYLSIRGFDQRRISVAVNGIPQNDPEDHNVYWIDFPDLLESTELIQVQRGTGSGIIGYPAVGGSINIITSSFSDRSKIEFTSSLGSYNTRKYSASYSSGLINNQYSFYIKLSELLSSGYRNSSWTNLKSYHFNVVRYDEKLTTQINLFGGPIEDGLAYTGLPKFAIKDKSMRKANYSDWGADGNGYTYTVERRPQEIENFFQPHFELLNELKLSETASINSALFYVEGNGFFDYDASWADTNYFRITKDFGFHPTQNVSNALIHAMVENKQWGWIPRISFKQENGELILGGEIRIHRSFHWGSIKSADALPKSFELDYRYYSYNGGKNIMSFYAHENLNLTNELTLLAEAQLASHNYKLYDEKFLNYGFEVRNTFFNPRIGINYKYSPAISFYVSYAKVSREPRLKNYYDAAESSGGAVPQFENYANGRIDFTKPLVQPERMDNLELGASFTNKSISGTVNVFYMHFNNEIVSQGQVDRFGQPITGNMNRTIHYGIELTADYKPNKNTQLIVNSSFSKNYISDGVTYQNYINPFNGNEEVAKIDLTNNSISGFPEVILNGIIKFSYEKLFAQFGFKYVGSFYTDNYGAKLQDYLKTYPEITSYTDNLVDSYLVANIFLSYDISFEKCLSNLRLFLQINNVFDNYYAAYGIGKEFFPAAERNFIFGIKLGI